VRNQGVYTPWAEPEDIRCLRDGDRIQY
jgi:hypothetical protein